MCTLNATEEYERVKVDNLQTCAKEEILSCNHRCKKCGIENDRMQSFGLKGCYCKTCFLSISTHKFRAAIGKSKSIRPGDTVLLAYSGNASSTVLAHLIKSGRNEPTGKKLLFRTVLLYIDDAVIKGQTADQRAATIQGIAQEAQDFGEKGYAVNLSWSIDGTPCTNLSPIETFSSCTKQDAALLGLFDALRDDTAKDELLRRLRHRLLVSVARQLNCNKILLADTSTDIAINLLTDVSTGRGVGNFAELSFHGKNLSRVTIFRPLRDFNSEDISYYLQCHSLTPVLEIVSRNSSSSADSVRRVAEDFVADLSRDFQSTVSTIYRTSEKLAGKPIVDTSLHETCLICDVQLDGCHYKGESSAVQAVAFSKLMSTVQHPVEKSCPKVNGNSSHKCGGRAIDAEEGLASMTDSSKTKDFACNKIETCCNLSSSRPVTLKDADGYFCYSCKSLFRKFSDSNVRMLPDFLVDAMHHRQELSRMRREITDFLL